MAKDPNALLQKLDELAATDEGEHLPRSFGPYVLLAALARGGMGEVFLARSGAVAGFEKHCVVKTLRPHLTDDREYVARFIDEARVVVQLGHRNICQVFDVGRVGERYYLAMEQIAGKDLRTVVDAAVEPVPTSPMSSQRIPAAQLEVSTSNPQATPSLDAALVVHVMGEVLEALDYAHRFVDVSGRPLLLVHRDVSPQNVMVSYEGEVKLIDFGLAASTVKLEQTSPNVVMGKLAYMPPEQIRAEKLDARADLFSAAVMLTEMITGERYYQGIGSYEVWNLAAHGNFRPRRFNKITPSLRAILDKALSARAADRHANCADLREALMTWRQQQGLYADAATLRRLMHQRFAEDITAHRALLAGLSHARPAAQVAPVPQESSKSFARAEPSMPSSPSPSPSSSSSTSAPLPMRALPASEVTLTQQVPTRETSLVQRRPRRRIILGIAAGVAVGVAAFIGLTVAESKPKTPVTAVGVVTNPVDPADVVAVPLVVDAGVPAPIEPVRVASVAGAVDAGAAVEPVLELPVEPLDAPDPKVRGKKPTKKPKPEPEPPTTTTVETKPPPPDPPKDPPLPAWSTLSMPKKVAALQKLCAEKCVAPLAAGVATWAAGTPSQMSQFRNDVEACHTRCGKP